jgi:cobalt-zinc-cadmium efflux system membrane fusion protein
MNPRLFTLVLLAAISGCRDRAPAAPVAPANAPEHHSDEPEHESLPTRVRLDPQVVRDARIQTAPVAREALAATIDLPGEVAFDPDMAARVSAWVGGRIEALHFKEGQAVKQHDLLATIRVPELSKARAAYTASAAKAAAARSNAERLKKLAAERLAAQQEVLAAEAEAAALAADTEAAAAQLSTLGFGARDSSPGGSSQLQLRAPISGDIVTRDAVFGQTVDPEHVIATIADMRELWFLGRVFEKNLEQIRVGARVEVQLNAYPDQKFAGVLEYIGKQVDPSARTVTARIRIRNRDELLRLGLFGVARVDIGEHRDQADEKPELVVPRSAVTQIGDQTVVFVQQPDGDFDVHAVVLGDGALGKVQVLHGLRDGERIVTHGAFTLKSAVLKSTFREEE